MTKSLVRVPSGTSDESYISWARQVPPLSESEEHELFLRFQRDHDAEAAKKLVLHHMRFVVYIARGFVGYGLPQADLVQEGTVVLMKAIQKFDLNYGVRLVTFAVYWIKAEIHDYILRNWRVVKIATTKAQRKLFFNLRKWTKNLAWMNDAETKQVAQALEVTPAEVRQMEARLNAPDYSLDSGDGDSDNDSETSSPIIYLTANVDTEPVHQLIAADEKRWQTRQLRRGLLSLDARSREIIVQRWLKEPKRTLQELASKYQISAERVRQIEALAMKKLAKFLSVPAVHLPSCAAASEAV